ncbi:MAG: type II toxin-antitoxin system prevent-host-death family antitoxin [Acetatifactor sp.]|nr:type II toxin-antitoxin system prevent-host-death family antitoxin [Acetatifactor sp.]
MAKTKSIMNQFVPISLFNQGQASKIFERVKTEGRLFVMKNNKPSAVILSPEEYEMLTERLIDNYLYEEALHRLKRADGHYLTEEETMRSLGITEEDLANCEEVEIE